MKHISCNTCGLVQPPPGVGPLHQFYVVKDANGETYSTHCDPSRHVRDVVHELCVNAIIIDDGERVEWGTVIASDAEAARVSHAVQWIGFFVFSEGEN